VSKTLRVVLFGSVFLACAVAQQTTVTNVNVGSQYSQSPLFSPDVSGTVPRALFGVYSERSGGLNLINTPGTYQPASPTALNSAISSAIGVALSLIPIASPASAVIRKTDPATGLEVGADSTLGPIFTERAETIGKHKAFLGVSHQAFHFTSINGDSLNGLTILYKGGDSSTIPVNGGKTQPATFNMGLDVRLSQDLAFFTYGLTDRLDVSVGVPMVHSAVSATSYDGLVFTGDGLGGGGPQPGSNCWCMNSLAPGTFQTTQAFIGQSSLAKTGIGDLLVRVKAAIVDRSQAVVSAGADLRFATGDASNFLGTGTTTVKPFLAVSLYSKPTASGVVFSPHFNVGWQISGKSVLGGTLNGTPQTVNLAGETVPFIGAPMIATKDYLPDVFQWSAGTEFALGRRNTVVLDILGNQIGWIHGAETVREASAPGFSPIAPFAAATATGMVDGGRTSFGQYNGSFGYKVRVVGNLVATFNALVRLDNNGLTARFTPLYGLSYSFN
jgi:hypothetical protein